MDITHDGMIKLDNELTRRDRTLTAVSRNLRRKASGQTASYHKMLNKLEHFTKLPLEPSEEEKNALIASMGEYVLTDCAPGSPVGDEEAMMDVMCALRSMVPEENFKKLLDQVNTGRRTPFTAADFEKPKEEPAAERANAVTEQDLAAMLG